MLLNVKSRSNVSVVMAYVFSAHNILKFSLRFILYVSASNFYFSTLFLIPDYVYFFSMAFL